MNAEQQLQFIDAEISVCTAKLAALNAIRASIDGSIAPQLASLPDLITTNATLTTQKATLEQTVAAKEGEIETLTRTVSEKDTEIVRLTETIDSAKLIDGKGDILP